MSGKYELMKFLKPNHKKFTQTPRMTWNENLISKSWNRASKIYTLHTMLLNLFSCCFLIEIDKRKDRTEGHLTICVPLNVFHFVFLFHIRRCIRFLFEPHLPPAYNVMITTKRFMYFYHAHVKVFVCPPPPTLLTLFCCCSLHHCYLSEYVAEVIYSKSIHSYTHSIIIFVYRLHCAGLLYASMLPMDVAYGRIRMNDDVNKNTIQFK